MKRGLSIVLALAILCMGVASTLMTQPTHASANAAVQYADSHWDCVDSACTSTVLSGLPQDGFQCAEFVARSLSTEGLIPNLNSDSPQSDYQYYHASNGKTYDLLWVGWANKAYTTAMPGLYQYLVENGIGSDIGANPTSADPGDVVIYHEGEGHTALVVQAGSDPLIDAHNDAQHNYPNSQEYADFTIVHIVSSGTPPPAPVVGSWPTLKEGSTGEDVTSVQLMLEAQGYSLSVDGNYGPQTAATVRSFQASYGLSVDGEVGAQTWPALIITTSQGSSGAAVMALQRQLNAHGANLVLDGTFGALTTAAVSNFQSSQGLSVDGIAGLQTWENLVS